MYMNLHVYTHIHVCMYVYTTHTVYMCVHIFFLPGINTGPHMCALLLSILGCRYLPLAFELSKLFEVWASGCEMNQPLKHTLWGTDTSTNNGGSTMVSCGCWLARGLGQAPVAHLSPTTFASPSPMCPFCWIHRSEVEGYIKPSGAMVWSKSSVP